MPTQDQDQDQDRMPRGVNPGGPMQRPPGHDGRSQLTHEEIIRRRGPRRGYQWRKRRYAQAEHRPADYQIEPAAYSTGPGSAEEYHYHRTPTYHHQYADQLAHAESPPPQQPPQRKGWLLP